MGGLNPSNRFNNPFNGKETTVVETNDSSVGASVGSVAIGPNAIGPNASTTMSQRDLINHIDRIADERRRRIAGGFDLHLPRFDLPFDIALLNKMLL